MYYYESKMQVCSAHQIALTTDGKSKVQSVFVEFIHDEPIHWKSFSDENSNWASLDSQTADFMLTELIDAIMTGNVKTIYISFDIWSEDLFLTIDFENGWAAPLYNMIGEYSVAPYNEDYIDINDLAPVQIGGQTPVPKMFALNDMELIAKIVSFLLEKGQLYPELQWAKSIDAGLPWH